MDAKQAILVVSTQSDRIAEFIGTLSRDHGYQVYCAGSAEEAIASLGSVKPILVIVDQQVEHISALDLVRRLIAMDAFVHTAVISGEETEKFHDASEGLGVLSQLPVNAGSEDAHALLERLRRLAPPVH